MLSVQNSTKLVLLNKNLLLCWMMGTMHVGVATSYIKYECGSLFIRKYIYSNFILTINYKIRDYFSKIFLIMYQGKSKTRI